MKNIILTRSKLWEKWLEIEPQIHRWARSRWRHAAFEDVLQGAALLFVSGKPQAGKELGYAMYKCREAARNQGYWTPGKIQEVATDPADMPAVPDDRDPEYLMIREQKEAAEAVRREQAESMILLLAPALACALRQINMGSSMAEACRASGISQSRLSKVAAMVGRKVTGHTPIRQQRRRNQAAEVGQLSLGLV